MCCGKHRARRIDTYCAFSGHAVPTTLRGKQLQYLSTVLFVQHPQPLWKKPNGGDQNIITVYQVLVGKGVKAAFPQACTGCIHMGCGKHQRSCQRVSRTGCAPTVHGLFCRSALCARHTLVSRLRIYQPTRRDFFGFKWIAHLSTGFSSAHPHSLWRTSRA